MMRNMKCIFPFCVKAVLSMAGVAAAVSCARTQVSILPLTNITDPSGNLFGMIMAVSLRVMTTSSGAIQVCWTIWSTVQDRFEGFDKMVRQIESDQYAR